MDKLKTFLTNAINYNQDLIKKANEILFQYDKKPESLGIQQVLISLAIDSGKRVVRLSELIRIYDEAFKDPIKLDEDILEQVRLSREDFLHLRGEELEAPTGVKITELISQITQKEKQNERKN